MASKVTSVAIEFGVELKRFRDDLKKAGKYNEEEIQEMSKVWIREEKAKSREQKRELRKREKREKEFTKSVINGYHMVAAAVTAAAAGAAAAFVEIRNESEQTRATIAKLNQTTGLTTETLAGIQLAGGPEFLERFGEAAGEFQKRLSDAGRGTGELLPYLKKLGISIRDQNGDLRETDAVLRDYIKALQEAGDTADASAGATAGLGAAGRELMAELGGTDLETFVKLSGTFGADVGDAAMDATREWGVQTRVLKESLSGAIDRTATMILSGLDLSETLYGLSAAVLWVDAQLQAFGTGTSPIDYVRKSLGEMALPIGVLLDKSPLLKMAIMQLGFGTLDVAEAQDKLAKSEKNLSNAQKDAAVRYAKSMTALNTRIDIMRENAKKAKGAVSDLFEDPAIKSGKDKEKAEAEKREAELLRQAEESYRARIAFIQSHKTTIDVAAALNFVNFEYDKENLLEVKKEIASELLQFRELEVTTDTIGGPEMSAMMNGVSDAFNEPIKKIDIFKDKVKAAGEDMAEIGPKLHSVFEHISDHVTAGMGLIDNVMQLVAKNLDAYSWRARRTMRTLFQVQKALSISNIIMSTAQATIAALMPPPIGLGPLLGAPMAAITAATGMTQIALVAAEQPPSFHTGGMIGTPGPMPDEVGITALSGEGVVSRRGMATLDAINRGEMPGGGASVAVYGARVFDAVQGDLARMPTSAMSRAIRAKTRRRVGHRS